MLLRWAPETTGNELLQLHELSLLFFLRLNVLLKRQGRSGAFICRKEIVAQRKTNRVVYAQSHPRVLLFQGLLLRGQLILRVERELLLNEKLHCWIELLLLQQDLAYEPGLSGRPGLWHARTPGLGACEDPQEEYQLCLMLSTVMCLSAWA